MKINDKHLCRIATGSTPIDKEGILLKRGEVNKSFQKRWFVLKGNLLFYYDKKGERDPIGVVIIEGCTVELAEMTDAFTFELVFPGSSSRTYILAAETQEEMESWMKAITCASYDYMKLMVTELQRQIDECNEEQRKHAKHAVKNNVQDNGEQARMVNDQLLVDLTSQVSFDDSLDPFGSPEASWNTSGPAFPLRGQSTSKQFEQLHEEYGKYIMQKMRETQLAK